MFDLINLDCELVESKVRKCLLKLQMLNRRFKITLYPGACTGYSVYQEGLMCGFPSKTIALSVDALISYRLLVFFVKSICIIYPPFSQVLRSSKVFTKFIFNWIEGKTPHQSKKYFTKKIIFLNILYPLYSSFGMWKCSTIMCPWACAQRVIFLVLEHTLKGSFFGSLSRRSKGHLMGSWTYTERIFFLVLNLMKK